MELVRVAGVCVGLALLTPPAQERATAAPASCESLASLRLPNATVTSAAEIAPGEFRLGPAGAARAMAALPAFCRVAVTSKPTADSDIKIEVWFPASGWNGKFQAVGNGGWAGSMSYAAMAAAMTRGYATASTDTGHSTPGASFVMGHPEKLVDSDSYIPPQKYPAIHEAVMQACDAADGVKDGVLEDPARCRFDPKVLQCKEADGPSCLTAEQVDTARALYSEVKHPQTGRVLSPPLLQPGSELGWATLAGPQPFANAAEAFKFLASNDPAWEPARFDAATDLALMDKAGAVLNTVSPNLKPFFARGGKLLMYHGWNDRQVPASSSVSYFTRVVDTVGKSAVGKSIQLYMVPGMNHCQGGVGTDTFDKIAAIEEWMARGVAPDQIVASHATAGKVDRTRPLCPYPQVAVYKGAGSTDEASSFTCRNPR